MRLWTPKKMDQAQTVLRMVKANIKAATTTQVVRIAMGARVRCRLRDWYSSRAIKRIISSSRIRCFSSSVNATECKTPVPVRMFLVFRLAPTLFRGMAS